MPTLEHQGGRQIHLLSVRALLALRGPGYSAYCATRGGLAMLVKQQAMELAPHGITVNGVAPTFIQSDRIRRHLDRPVRHVMTGQIVCVDGGVTASQ